MRKDRGIELIELVIIIAVTGIVIGLLLGLTLRVSKDRADKAKGTRQVSYAIKHTATYEVTIRCMNCAKMHDVEYAVGRKVQFEHRCPNCGIEGELVLAVDDKK